ncbi:cell wall-binding protein [Clostridium perfringens]|uniref:cell wall-binding protein n=1 Tax=Clostridium perfringens TaxID=1502 RepID=UPI0028CC619A|nr:cell wall-binding protein [Clostridium perfringens]MDT7984702.1 cell wall-binding protein [Clostridium perfringens]MDT8040222.1 cell wall-binding protein [Clostridium perfringens]
MKRRRIITTLILTLTLSLQSISVFAQPNKEVSNISSEKTDINNGWVHENNNWYYITNGTKATSWKKINDYWYYFDNDGNMQTDWQEIGGVWYYFRPDGIMATGWQKVNDYWYYFSDNGAMQTDWKQLNEVWYYFRPDGIMATNWQKVNDYWYYFDNNGAMQTNWQEINNNWYYFREDGIMATNWQKVNDYFYFFNNNGIMQTDWHEINNKWYHFRNDGIMSTGWQNIDDDWYLFNDYNGDMQIGWASQNDKWYYLSEETGAMVKDSEKTINGNIYKFDSDGVMITDKWFESTYVNKDGIVLHSSPSRSHSYTQYKLFNYMSNEDNRESVHYAAIDLHGGETTNNCVYFTSEALRRAGVKIPLYVANTYQLERELLSRGWIKSTNTSDLRPGDVVFSGYKHSFTFMNWYDDDYAYIVDNQKKYFDSVLHKRLVSVDDPVNDTIRATHFFYLPE